jgi:protein dithiol:quinone oxidoreductase
MTKRFYRAYQSLFLFVTLLVVTFSFYFQYYSGLQPCPLCLMQRVCAMVLGVFFLMGLCVSTLKRARVVVVMQMVFSVFGSYFALRQLWLQSLPTDQAPACMPGLDIMMKYFPWQDIIQALLLGAGDCAEVDWNWLVVSMAGWSAMYFMVMFCASFLSLWMLTSALNKR